jgi:hypothetical protein
MAFGMDLPGLVDTLRARTRTPDYGLDAEYVVNAPTKGMSRLMLNFA